MGTNGLLSFDIPYDFWFNVVFPGSVEGRYLVAAFWDDADATQGSGQVSYEIYETGYQLDYVSAFIRRRNPSSFQGTWMMVTMWNSVQPFSFSFFPPTEVGKFYLMCNSYTKMWLFLGEHVSSNSDNGWHLFLHCLYL